MNAGFERSLVEMPKSEEEVFGRNDWGGLLECLKHDVDVNLNRLQIRQTRWLGVENLSEVASTGVGSGF